MLKTVILFSLISFLFVFSFLHNDIAVNISGGVGVRVEIKNNGFNEVKAVCSIDYKNIRNRHIEDEIIICPNSEIEKRYYVYSPLSPVRVSVLVNGNEMVKCGYVFFIFVFCS